MSPHRKYGSKKTTSYEGKKEYQREYMQEYRQRKREENKLLDKIRRLEGYESLSKEDQKAIDQAFLSSIKQFDEMLEKARKELGPQVETVLRREMAVLEKQFTFILARYSDVAKQLETLRSQKKVTS